MPETPRSSSPCRSKHGTASKEDGIALALALLTSRIAVIAIGADPVTAGQLQRGVEVRLVALPSVELMDAASVAAELGTRPVAADETIDPSRVEALLEASRQDLRNGEFDDALTRLAEAEKLVAVAATGDRVGILLQRAAVLLKKEDAEAAGTAARAALELQPDLTVDLRVFPPSLDALVGDVRSTLPIRHLVELRELPASATVRVDGRPVAPRFAATPGRHKLSLAAPGFRSVEIAIDVAKSVSIDVGLPLELEEPLETALIEQVWAADPLATERTAARGLATRLKVDAVVLVASRIPSGEARALVIWRAADAASDVGPTKPTSEPGRAALAEWAARSITIGAPETAAVKTTDPCRDSAYLRLKMRDVSRLSSSELKQFLDLSEACRQGKK